MSNFWKVTKFKQKQVAQEYLRVDIRSLHVTKPTVPMYHISLDSNLPETLVPRIPYSNYPDDAFDDEPQSKKTTLYTEPQIARVSFSSSVEGAIRGIYVSLESVFEKAKGQDVNFIVYELVPGNARFVAPETLARRAIHDALVTQEWWALDPVQIKLISRMSLSHDRDAEWITYRPFGGKEVEHSPKDLITTVRK